MERTTNNRSLDSNVFAFDGARRDPQRAPYGPSTDFSAHDSIPLFLTDLQGQPDDPQEFAPLAAIQRTSILTRFVRDTRSITPDPVMARDWYRKAASFGSAEAQQRLTSLHN
jgi:hypothetical protein